MQVISKSDECDCDCGPCNIYSHKMSEEFETCLINATHKHPRSIFIECCQSRLLKLTRFWAAVPSGNETGNKAMTCLDLAKSRAWNEKHKFCHTQNPTPSGKSMRRTAQLNCLLDCRASKCKQKSHATNMS